MNSVMMFLSLMTSFRFPTFLFRFLTLMPTVLLVTIYFHLLIVAFAYVAISVFLLAKKRWPFSFHRFWDIFCDHIRDAAQEDIFNLGLSTAASEFYEWFMLELMYIYLMECIKSSIISLWFSADVTVIAYRNHFFHLYQ